MHLSLRTIYYSSLLEESAPTEVPIDITGRSNVEAFGDSITDGQNASAGNSYIELFDTARAGITTVRNNAVGGCGVWNQAAACQTLSFTRSQTLFVIMCGLNDVRRNGSAAKTLKKIEAGFRTLILKGIGNTQTASGSASVTRTGTVVQYAADTLGGRFPTGIIPANCASVSSAASAATWTWTFTGTAFGIQFMCNSGDTETYGTCTIKVDGAEVYNLNLNNWYDNVSDGAYDNRRGPLGLTFHDFTSGEHTVVVTSAAVGYVAIDFFCTINTPDNSCAFALCEIPYLNAEGYATSPAEGSTVESDAASEVIRGLVAEYQALGYKFVYVPINDFYNLTTGLDTDDIHPNDTGHAQFFNALTAAVV